MMATVPDIASRLTLIPTGRDTYTPDDIRGPIVLPPDATVRLGDKAVRIPAGQHRIVAWDGDYQLIDWARGPRLWRVRAKVWAHTMVDRLFRHA